MNPHFESIADGLADNGYAVIDQFLSPKEVSDILSCDGFTINSTSFKRAGIGKSNSLQIKEEIRGDYIQWLDKATAPQAIQIYLQRIDLLVRYLNEALYLGLKDFESHCTVYPAGTYYKRHLDQFKTNNHRKISVICYLNINWKEELGGQLRMYLSEKSIDVFPIAGRLVCFRSDQIEHEVLPATCERLSITGWMLDQIVE